MKRKNTSSKEKMEIMHAIKCTENASIQFGSDIDVIMQEIFMSKEMVQTGTSVNTIL